MSDQELYTLFNAALWNDHEPSHEFYIGKPLLAHYTSVSVLESILLNKELWMSNPLFMNDLEEVRFGFNNIAPRVFANQEIIDACKSNERAKIFFDYFNFLFQKFSNQDAMDTYVFCLSEHDITDFDGRLSMWRGYGGNGNGVAIVFDTGKLTAVENSPMILAKVIYATVEERLVWLDRKIADFSQVLSAIFVPDDKLHIVAWMLFQRLKMFALFAKHNGFAEEKEWRLVYVNDRDHLQLLAPMYGYNIGNQGVEPKLKLKMEGIKGITPENFSIENIIDRILVGPSISSPLVRDSITRMISTIGMPGLGSKVYSSTIPFRQM